MNELSIQIQKMLNLLQNPEGVAYGIDYGGGGSSGGGGSGGGEVGGLAVSRELPDGASAEPRNAEESSSSSSPTRRSRRSSSFDALSDDDAAASAADGVDAAAWQRRLKETSDKLKKSQYKLRKCEAQLEEAKQVRLSLVWWNFYIATKTS